MTASNPALSLLTGAKTGIFMNLGTDFWIYNRVNAAFVVGYGPGSDFLSCRNRISPGHDGRARRRALGLDVIVVEADALAGHLVDTRCGYRSAVYPETSPADVVHQNEHDVGLLL